MWNVFKDRTGEKHITNEGYEIEIIECFGRKNCTIIFKNGLTLKNKQYHHIKNGSIRNPYHPSVYGVGYLGIGEYKTKSGNKSTLAYSTWGNAMTRCYSEKNRHSYPTYIDIGIFQEWHNFQNFAKWFYENYNPEIMKDWQFDKDILFKGNKIYSPETCCFVPKEVNMLFVKKSSKRGKNPIGTKKENKKYKANHSKNKMSTPKLFDTAEEAFEVYKNEKEAYIKKLADKWKGKITEKVYEAMYNYEVEITD